MMHRGSLNRSLPPVPSNRLALVPRSDIPRSRFKRPGAWKGTFQAGKLIPFFIEECIPGDAHRAKVQIFARIQTMIFPIFDNLKLETFFFFVPIRIIWDHFVNFMGEQKNPSDSINYLVPQIVSPTAGFPVHSNYDYLGVPCFGQIGGGATISINALPLRAVAKCRNDWFRDENLENSVGDNRGDGPDLYTDYPVFTRAKPHDYFTTALPWPQKGPPVTIPLVGQAAVSGIGFDINGAQPAGYPGGGFFAETPATMASSTPGNSSPWNARADYNDGDTGKFWIRTKDSLPRIYAELGTATGASLNDIRQAVAIQHYYEKNARGGTRYVELLVNRFGIQSQDARLQRPEYIGGGRSYVQTSAIPQTSQTSGANALGALGGTSVVSDQHSFSYHVPEHGYIVGFVHVGAVEMMYTQGLHPMWTRQTRLDFYDPDFANLGEQAVLRREIFCDGSANDTLVFGYQERYAEYRYLQSKQTGFFRPTTALNIDEWTLSEQFLSAPNLNADFIKDPTALTLQRALAAGASADNMQVLMDTVIQLDSTRPMPVYGVPGLDRF